MLIQKMSLQFNSRFGYKIKLPIFSDERQRICVFVKKIQCTKIRYMPLIHMYSARENAGFNICSLPGRLSKKEKGEPSALAVCGLIPLSLRSEVSPCANW